MTTIRGLLLVCADPRWRHAYRAVFSHAGWRIYSALDLQSAIDVLKSDGERVDALLWVARDPSPDSTVALLESLSHLPRIQQKAPTAMHVVVSGPSTTPRPLADRER